MLNVFQLYRVVVLPVANTWMSWSLLNKMEVTPSYGVIALLGVILVAFMIMGVQVSQQDDAGVGDVAVLEAVALDTKPVCELKSSF